jgi:hypothetical protein
MRGPRAIFRPPHLFQWPGKDFFQNLYNQLWTWSQCYKTLFTDVSYGNFEFYVINIFLVQITVICL